MPPAETRATRTSPRKATRELRYTSLEDEETPILIPKSSRRELRYFGSSSQDADEASLIPRTVTAAEALTPRKQRILRPVESNSRLLRKLSDESLASPEKRRRERRVRSGTTDTDVGKRERLLYAKSLARSVVNKQAHQGKIHVVGEAEVQEAAQRPRSRRQERQEQVLNIDMDEEAETSLWCGDEEEETAQGKEVIQLEESSDEDDEDEEPVVNARNRRRQPQARRVASESEEEESEGPMVETDNRIHPPSVNFPENKSEDTPATEQPQPLTFMQPPHRKGHSTISNWAQEVIDLTSSPGPQAASVLPQPTHVRTASFASSRPTSSASNGALAILT